MYELFRKIVVLYIKLKFKLYIKNDKNIPRDLRKGGYIVAANHQKYYDPVLIARVFRARFAFMAKSELFKGNKFFAALIRFCGAFPVVRGAGDNKAVETALNSLENGRVFVIFPEGKRSKDGTIGRARSGVALIAAQAGVPVIPVCIMYGLHGNKRRVDLAIGEIIRPEKMEIAKSAGEIDFTTVKKVSADIINSIKSLQQEILSECDNSERKD